MADLDPSQEAERLLDGPPGVTPTGYGGDPSPGSEGAIPPGGAGGNRSGGEADRSVRELEERLETTERRLADTQTAFHEQLNGRRLAESMVQAFDEARLRDQQIAAQAKAMEFPAFEGEPDDPQALNEHFRKVAEWSSGRTMATLMPYISEFDQMRRTMGNVYRDNQVRAFSDAKTRAEEEGFDDFDEFQGAISNRFSEMGPDGQALAMDSNNVFNAYIMMRAADKRPFATKKREDETPPPSLRARPSMPRGEKVRFRQLGGYASHIADAMGLDPNMELTDGEKRMIRHG